MYKLRTIDVWDTLLRRRCHPEFAKLATALHAFLDPRLGISERFDSVWDVYRLRVEQEMELADAARAAGRDNEYEIVDVLTHWLKKLVDQEFDAGIPAQFADFEVNFELRHTYPDPTIRQVAEQHPAENTIFLSDFYMSAERLSTLLEGHGIDAFVPGGISSCDLGMNKRSGKLFGHVQALYQAAPAEHVHIGDNAVADVEVPRSLGVNVVGFLPEAEHAKRLDRELLFADRAALFQRIDAEVLADLGERADAFPALSAREAAMRAGAHAAPLVIGFCLDIARRAIVEGLEQVYFFSREGEFFLRVWHALFPRGEYAGHVLPKASVLEVSRFATFCASLREVTPAEMRRLWNLYTTHSLAALLKSIGMEPESFSALCARHRLSLDEDITHPWKDERIQRLFADADFSSRIEERVRAERAALLAYLASQGLSDEARIVGIVDIGWRGTIQDNLALLLPAVQFRGHYLGLQRYLNEQPSNVSKRAFGPNRNETSEDASLLDAVAPIEMLFSSSAGSVCGYRTCGDGGKVAAIRAEPDVEHASSKDFIEGFQAGVLRGARAWAGHVEMCGITADELRKPALKIWASALENPLDEFVAAYSALNQNDVFGAGQFVDKSVVPGIGKLFRSLVSAQARREVIMYIRQNQWTAGIQGRRDLGVVHRTVLVLVMRLAQGYKRWMYLRRDKRSIARNGRERDGRLT
ncbi:hypothetical protein AWB77_01330 [Caballeronia fortuita]|uniref:Haloacid dehalogenase n=1 Tax=Caballeronia fortuita TaxID=1777138 RepID=A0A158A215_9BURK|nr:hypothetical protein [Caballeronia fortuita]SAK51686.1 hypothetical protein AWB77_01330 [Caballeronia fortuita]